MSFDWQIWDWNAFLGGSFLNGLTSGEGFLSLTVSYLNAAWPCSKGQRQIPSFSILVR